MTRHRPPTFSQDMHDVLTGPLIHYLAADLQHLFTRKRTHPLGLHLAYLALQRSIGSANKLDAELATPGTWSRFIDAYNLGSAQYGTDDKLGRYLPQLTSDTFRHARNTLAEAGALEEVCDALTTLSLAMAVDVGLLPKQGGSLTYPHRLRTIYGDGTIVRPLYAHNNGGQTDPDAAEHRNHTGQHWGNNMVIASCRGPNPHQRIILGVARTPAPGGEAATAVDLFGRIIDGANGRIQAVLYDGALRGTHHNDLMRKHGVVPVTRVHAGARRDGQRTFRTIPLDVRTHTVRGRDCAHTLVIKNGAIHETHINAAGEHVLSEPLARRQVRRTRSKTKGYRFAIGVIIACQHGPFDAWFSIHPHADQLRLLPEHDPYFMNLYPIRSDSESNNNSFKRTLPSKRAASLGWQRQLLDLVGWAILVNSRAHARYA